MRRPVRSKRRAEPLGTPTLVAVAVLAVLVAACAPAGAADVSDERECFLGLDLWDTDPALTWIEDGRVWVRTGDLQACLARTTATSLHWGPDGRRILLDDELFDAGDQSPVAAVPAGAQVVWQQPFGDAIFARTASQQIAVIGSGPSFAPGTQLVASHPDGAHFAVAASDGTVTLIDRTGAEVANLLEVGVEEDLLQLEFAPDGARLWALVDDAGASTARYVDMVPISDVVDVPPVESIVPGMSLPTPELFYIDADRAEANLLLTVGVGATGTTATRFTLHPAHRDWIALSEGSCGEARSSLFVGGELMDAELPGSVVGFFRGHGQPVLATTAASSDCGSGQLWVVEGLPGNASVSLVAEDITSASIRAEAPDPWNPNTAPPFA